MSDEELLELCKQHFAFLGKASQHVYLRDVKTGKRTTSRKVIENECAIAITRIEEHFKANETLGVPLAKAGRQPDKS